MAMNKRKLAKCVLLTGTCAAALLLLYTQLKLDIHRLIKFEINPTTSDEMRYGADPVQSSAEGRNVFRPYQRAEEQVVPAHQQAQVHVAVFGDKKMFPGLMTLATSIINNTHSDVMLHFVTLTDDADTLRTIIEGSAMRTVAYEVLAFSEDKVEGNFVVRSPRKNLNHSLNAARFFLGELLPDLDRVIFIDADCLVLGDIKELYDVKIADRHVITALSECDVSRRYTAQLVLNYSHPAVLAAGVPRNACIISAGVFVANLTRWRQEGVGARMIQWMKLNARSPVVRFSDRGSGSQAIMLLVLHDRFTPLPASWHVLKSKFKKSPDSDKLLHWNGKRKPWLSRCARYDLWARYYHLFRGRLEESASRLFLDTSF